MWARLLTQVYEQPLHVVTAVIVPAVIACVGWATNRAENRRLQFANLDTLVRDYAKIGNGIRLLTQGTSDDVRAQARNDIDAAILIKQKIKEMKPQPETIKKTESATRTWIGVWGGRGRRASTPPTPTEELASLSARIQQQYQPELEARRAWLYFYDRVVTLHKADLLPPPEHRTRPTPKQIVTFLDNCELWDCLQCASMPDCDSATGRKPRTYDYMKNTYLPEQKRAKKKTKADIHRNSRA
jgi:hypothetical protein